MKKTKKTKKPTKRLKLPSLKTARNKADSYLTPIIKALHPKCAICGKETQVAHHFVHKSSSNKLRYELENLVNLCNPCHFRLHQNESYWAAVLVSGLGMKWFERMKSMKDEYVKADVHWYIEQGERLKVMLIDAEKMAIDRGGLI